MRSILRLCVVASAAALGAFGLLPAAHAATRTVTVDDFATYEGSWRCTANPPFSCSIRTTQLRFQIHLSPSPTQNVMLGWRLEDISATAGLDYTGPTSGTVTFPANGFVTHVYVPVVLDSVTEANETVRFRITSSSIPADITDTAIGTIRDGTAIPPDCTVSQTTYNNMFMDCTSRPPTQRWHLQAFCANIGGGDFWDGNIVTGNGRSSITSCGGYAYYPYFIIDP